MRIDWAQTLIGASSPSSAAESEQEAGLPAAFPAARLAGVLATTFGIGLSIASMPWRGSIALLPEILGLSGYLLAFVTAFLSAPRHGARFATFFALLPLGFVVLAGVSASTLAALVALACLDLVLLLPTPGRSKPAAAGVLALAVFITAAASLSGQAGWTGGMLGIVAAVPVIATALQAFRREKGPVYQPAEEKIARLQALLFAASQGGARQTYVTDTVGAIDPEASQGFDRALQDELFPEGSIVAATLIADRVHLLNALSRAVHQGERTEGISVRLRREPAGAGYPMPPHYDPVACSVYPMPGVTSRAVIALDLKSASHVADAPAGSVEKNVAGPAELARALHDCNAPFNAGLGFLEMIADPRLAPRDIATYRDFAAEAHKAISEAHRNSVLLGRCLRKATGADGAVDVGEIIPSRLVQDAIRALNLRDAVDRGEIRINELEALPVAALPISSARFAVEVLLRHAQGWKQSELRLGRQGHDLVLTCRALGEIEDVALEDAFQSVLEQTASGGSIHFSTRQPGERSLVLADAFAIAGKASGVNQSGIAGRQAEWVRLAS